MSFNTSLSGGWKRLTFCMVKMNWALLMSARRYRTRFPHLAPAAPLAGDGRSAIPLPIPADRDDLVDVEHDVAVVDHEPGAVLDAGQQCAAHGGGKGTHDDSRTK